jgi:regulatory protein
LQRDVERDLCVRGIKIFSEQNLQSDRRFADAFIRGLANKGIGESKVRHEVKPQKINGQIVLEVMTQVKIDWFELACHVFHKKHSGKTSK